MFIATISKVIVHPVRGVLRFQDYKNLLCDASGNPLDKMVLQDKKGGFVSGASYRVCNATGAEPYVFVHNIDTYRGENRGQGFATELLGHLLERTGIPMQLEASKNRVSFYKERGFYPATCQMGEHKADTVLMCIDGLHKFRK